MDLVPFLFLVIFLLLVLIFLLVFFLRRAQRKLENMTFQHRSVTVKHGQHWEQFAPFMDAFSQVAQRENFVFIGMPIDGIAFDDDGIKFIEMKTGKSQLNARQRQVKQHIQNKNVRWIELRF